MVFFWSVKRVNKKYIDTKQFTKHDIETFSMLTLSRNIHELTPFYTFARKMGYGVLCVENEHSLMTQLVAYSKARPLPDELTTIVANNAIEPHFNDPAPFMSARHQDY